MKSRCMSCGVESLSYEAFNNGLCWSCNRSVQSLGESVILQPKEDPLKMTREEFKETVFDRDRHKCVVCDEPAIDAHHLFERRLWSEGGYEIDNGVSLCELHHIQAEQTILSVDTLRELAGITEVILPDKLETGHEYDKWGNIILSNGKRMRGSLFWDESVQKVLPQEVKDVFTEYVKYPRTPYVYWSPGAEDDGILVDPEDIFYNQQKVIITEKMDGENTTMYKDFIHARSLDGDYHPSRTWVKNFWSQIAHDIPAGWRVCGENMYAVHSIKYDELSSYFLGFSLWNADICQPWDVTVEWFNLLDIEMVPVLFKGTWGEAKKELPELEKRVGATMEGYIIRAANGFILQDFQKSIVKYVRADHIQTTQHWKQGKVEKNDLKR